MSYLPSPLISIALINYSLKAHAFPNTQLPYCPNERSTGFSNYSMYEIQVVNNVGYEG